MSQASAEGRVVDEGYQRGLADRQISMMAIGGAIGTGLFLGAGSAIKSSGPSLILAYAVAGAVIFLIMRALGELLMYRTVSRSFADYAEEFIGKWAGFATGWVYWLMWVVTAMAEITAAGKYIKMWFPIPQWVTAAVVLGLLFLANLISVKLFGEFEFWFSMIKVVTIVGAIVLGLSVILFGFGPLGDNASFANLVGADGGFFPKGGSGTLMALQSVMFAYLGVELVGLTAGEARNPERVLPKAINNVVVRIGVFYVGALIVLLSLLPWTSFQKGESPFVLAFDKLGIPAAGGIINFVVLTAALSSCNSGIYSTGRMLRTLSLQGSAPRRLAVLSPRRVPAVGIALSAGVMALGIVINAVDPENAFTYVTSAATVAVLWTWGVILVCQLRYRAKVRAGELPASPFRMPGAPVTGYLALAFLAMVVVLLAFDSETVIALYVTPVIAAAIAVGYAVTRRREAAQQSAG